MFWTTDKVSYDIWSNVCPKNSPDVTAVFNVLLYDKHTTYKKANITLYNSGSRDRYYLFLMNN